MDFNAIIKNKLLLIEQGINQWLPAIEVRPSLIHEAMKYSIGGGGKRLRPLLLLAAFDQKIFPLDPIPAAIALECLHTYSLIHDDLPALDNSDLRRGKLSCHKKFDEALAILAGDALLTQAFLILSEAYRKKPVIANELVFRLSKAAGSQELIGGQVEDILGDKLPINEARIEFIHKNKTAVLIATSIAMGFILNESSSEVIEQAYNAGILLGLSFQLVDDLLDIEGDSVLMGKPVGLDEKNKKITYPNLVGIDVSKEKAAKLTKEALNLIESIASKESLLYFLANQLIERRC